MVPLPFFHFILYVICFSAVWLGAGLVVAAVGSLARSWHMPSFLISFFLLGILTSLPEISIGTAAIMNNDPAILAGTLLGGVMVLFLAVIPLLGVVGNGVRLPTQLSLKQLFLTLIVCATPAALTADQKISQWEAWLMIGMYGFLFVYFVSHRYQNNPPPKKDHLNHHPLKFLLKILAGIGLLIAGSTQIVASTLFFAEYFQIAPFFVSLIIVALGSNIPELSLIFRSVMAQRKSIAFADYLGSASANTLLMGVFALVYGQTIILPNHFLLRFTFLMVGLILFFWFARSKDTLSRAECLGIFLLYLGFVASEVWLLQ